MTRDLPAKLIILLEELSIEASEFYTNAIVENEDEYNYLPVSENDIERYKAVMRFSISCGLIDEQVHDYYLNELGGRHASDNDPPE